jgi:hypothetical protein
MERRMLSTLIVNDDDLECRKGKEKKEIKLEDIKLSSVGFVMSDLEKFDLIVYKGRLGKKVLRVRV